MKEEITNPTPTCFWQKCPKYPIWRWYIYNRWKNLG